MRFGRTAGDWRRLGLLALCVALTSAIVMTGPAAALSHPYAHRHYRHYHIAKRDGVPLRAAEAASTDHYGFQPFAPQQAWRRGGWRRDGLTTNERVARNRRVTDNGWGEIGWRANWQSNGWSPPGASGSSEIDGMAAAQAGAAGVPVSLVERVIKRESGGNPRAVSRGNYGLMQIRLGTARAMGYGGSAAGLLDAQTNMTYAVRYLAGAYRAAGGNENRAVTLYARGYYDVAKTQGFSPYGGGSYAVASNDFIASNSYGAPGFGYQPPEGPAMAPSSAVPHYRARHSWQHS